MVNIMSRNLIRTVMTPSQCAAQKLCILTSIWRKSGR